VTGTTPAWAHTGVILAGGASTRMGVDKATLTLADGRMMIEHVADALAAVCRRVLVVGGPPPQLDLPHLPDLRPGQGPLAGIESALAGGSDSQLLICPCDLPGITAEVLIALTCPSRHLATVLRIDGEAAIRPLPARLAADARPIASQLLDERTRAVRALIDRLDPQIVEAPAAWSTELRNVNTPGEYRRLKKSDQATKRPGD
jgi:molybdopterin-guanine dinucleotide biosynthesis protein A